jgi:tetratricopeptide (TPR) repeat protein
MDRAIAQYNIALQMEPNSGLAHWALGNALIFDGQYELAVRHLQDSVRLSGESPDEPVSLAFAYARSGKINEARKIADEVHQRSTTAYVPPTLFAIMASAMGDNNRAFEHLETAILRRDSLLVFMKVDPLFDPLRTDPRFAEFAERMGLP